MDSKMNLISCCQTVSEFRLRVGLNSVGGTRVQSTIFISCIFVPFLKYEGKRYYM